MISAFTRRFHNFVWFLIFTFTLYCMPHFELLFPYKFHLYFSETQAAEAQDEKQDEIPVSKEVPPSDETNSTSTVSSRTLGTGEGGGSGLEALVSIPENVQFIGAATSKIPIIVPPGRAGITPNISLTYTNTQGNGWVGVGWNLDIGAIQRSTKWGLNYSSNNYVTVMNGSYSELVSRTDWGSNYYGSKIEGASSKYYLNPSTGGWEMTSNEGTKYYYGTTSSSRQDNAYGVFKWCLDKVQDTKGNYMTITYTKDQGEIYLDRIDYTGNGSLGTTNYVKFYLEDRTDIYPMYTTNSLVKTAKRLKRIETYSSGQLQRKYVLNYLSDIPPIFSTSLEANFR